MHNTELIQLFQQFLKNPGNVIINNYRPDLILAAMQSESEAIRSENEQLRHELEKLQTSTQGQKVKEIDQQPTVSVSNDSSEINKLKKYIQVMKGQQPSFSIYDLNEYKIDNSSNNGKIGDGAQSNVYKVYKDERKYFAMKEFNVSSFTEKDLQRFINESEVLFALQHPCIIKIYGFNLGDANKPPTMILSLEDQSLEDSIKKGLLSIEDKCRIAIEIVLGMRFVHKNNFIHRDLKPSNILLSKDGHVRISDFGLAKNESFEESKTKGIGTLRFMAPELLQEDDGDLDYNNSVDVYAFAFVLYYIVNGSYPPFNLRNVSIGILPKMPDSMSKWVRNLIESCLQFNPSERPSFAQIFELMKSNKYNIFVDVNGNNASKNTKMAKIIQERVDEIEAFEFQC